MHDKYQLVRMQLRQNPTLQAPPRRAAKKQPEKKPKGPQQSKKWFVVAKEEDDPNLIRFRPATGKHTHVPNGCHDSEGRQLIPADAVPGGIGGFSDMDYLFDDVLDPYDYLDEDLFDCFSAPRVRGHSHSLCITIVLLGLVWRCTPGSDQNMLLQVRCICDTEQGWT